MGIKKVTKRESKAIGKAVAKWKIAPKRLDEESLEVIPWLFEYCVGREPNLFTRTLMQDLLCHIAALEMEKRSPAPSTN